MFFFDKQMTKIRIIEIKRIVGRVIFLRKILQMISLTIIIGHTNMQGENI